MRAFVPILTLTLLLTGCAEDKHTNPVVSPHSAIRVGVAFDIGGRGDKSFSDSAAKGIDRARQELGVEVNEVEASVGEAQGQKEARLRDLANAGYNPIIAVGFAYAASLARVAPAYPKVDFAIIDDDSVKADNVANLVFSEEQGSFLVGVIAAKASKTHVIGFIGGVHEPIIGKFEAGFAAGARTIDTHVVVKRTYLTEPPDFSGFTDPAAAERAARALYAAGADVVFHAAGGSGLGLFRAAVASGKWAIGVDADQYLQLPEGERDMILTSMIKRIDIAVFDFIKSAVNGDPTAGTKRYDLSAGGIDYSASNPQVAPYVPETEMYRQKLLTGKIVVPLTPVVRKSTTLHPDLGEG
jgi:Uncharacterized ABC-type transport system, periplasmic component/surface lipoprotein